VLASAARWIYGYLAPLPEQPHVDFIRQLQVTKVSLANMRVHKPHRYSKIYKYTYGRNLRCAVLVVDRFQRYAFGRERISKTPARGGDVSVRGQFLADDIKT